MKCQSRSTQSRDRTRPQRAYPEVLQQDQLPVRVLLTRKVGTEPTRFICGFSGRFSTATVCSTNFETQWGQIRLDDRHGRLDFVGRSPQPVGRRCPPFSAAWGSAEQTVQRNGLRTTGCSVSSPRRLRQIRATLRLLTSSLRTREGKGNCLIFRRSQFGNVDEYHPSDPRRRVNLPQHLNLKIGMDKGRSRSNQTSFSRRSLTCPDSRHTGTHLFTVSVAPKTLQRNSGFNNRSWPLPKVRSLISTCLSAQTRDREVRLQRRQDPAGACGPVL